MSDMSIVAGFYEVYLLLHRGNGPRIRAHALVRLIILGAIWHWFLGKRLAQKYGA